MEKFGAWYYSLPLKKKLPIQFLLQFFQWGLFCLLMKMFLPEPHGTVLGFLVKSTITATVIAAVMTTFYNWKNIKAAFIKQRNEQ